MSELHPCCRSAATVPAMSHWQDVQPVALKPIYPVIHWLHFSPVTPCLHSHTPVVWLHCIFDEPVVLQPQGYKEGKMSGKIYVGSKHKLIERHNLIDFDTNASFFQLMQNSFVKKLSHRLLTVPINLIYTWHY